MAQTTRERIIANPGRRKMTPKQIRFFGSARQRAALKATRKRAKSQPRHRPASRKNKGEIIGYTYPTHRANTGRKGKKNMAKATRKHKNKPRRSTAGYRPKKRKNTGVARRHHGYGHRGPAHRPKRRRSNPGMGLGNITGLAMNAVFVIAGAVGSKLLAQMVLGANNTGVVGYAGNAVAGGVLWFLAEKVLKNRNAAHGVIAGTAVQIVLRLINDYTPFGQYIANLGMGDYQAQSFVTPQVLVDPWNSAEISIPPAYRALAAPPVARGGVGSWENRSDYDGRSDY